MKKLKSIFGIVLLLVFSVILLSLFNNPFSNYHSIYDSHGESQISVLKKWKIIKRGYVDTIVSTDNDTLIWKVMRASKPEWDHHMKCFLEASPYDHDWSTNSSKLDTNLTYLDTIGNKKIIIRELLQMDCANNFGRVCLQIGIYSPGRFNYLYTKTDYKKYVQIRKEFREIGLSFKAAPVWAKQYKFEN